MIQDLRYTARTGELGAIGQVALLGALHMPEEMVAEVERRMVRVASVAVPVRALNKPWRTYYLPYIRTESADGLRANPDAIARLAERDPEDVPLLELAASLATGVMLTGDRALIDLGYAPESWLDTARTALDILRVDAAVASTIRLGVLGVQGALAMGRCAIEGNRSAQLVVFVTAIVTIA